MNELTARDRALIGLASAIGSNCLPCVEHHVPMAREAGLTDAEIEAAITLADSIRQVPARRVLATARHALSAAPMVLQRVDDEHAHHAGCTPGGACC